MAAFRRMDGSHRIVLLDVGTMFLREAGEGIGARHSSFMTARS